jgi:hypothetical protein
MPKLITFPGWAAPWLFAGVFIYIGFDALEGHLSMFEPMGALIVSECALFGFLIGIPFWIRDRRRGR